jgi:hypothetical protein
MGLRRYLLLIALAASFLAAGCCCPPISGRYCDNGGCCPPPRAVHCCCPLCIACCLPAAVSSPSINCQPPECSPPERLVSAEPAPINTGPLTTDGSACNEPCHRFPCCGRLHAWFAGFRQGVPSQQHPDYYSPPARFHPIPTRPAFESLPTYPSLLPADSGMNNPLRASNDQQARPTVR